MNKLTTAITLILLAALILLIIAISNEAFRSTRVDLTEDRLHTLSPGTESVLQNLPTPVKLRLYYSRSSAQENPAIKARAREIIDLLKVFDAAAGDKLTVTYHYPEPSSEEARQAGNFDLQEIGYGPYGSAIYLGLVGTNSLDNQIVIPHLALQSGQGKAFDNIEYDIAKMVFNLSHIEKRKIGLITGLPILGVPNAIPSPQNPGEWQSPPWLMAQHAEELFELQSLGAAPSEIPDGIDALWIVHPKQLPPATIFAIDQFVLNGGPTVIFVDPLAQVEQARDEFSMAAPRSSDLAPLFEAWGVTYDAASVVIDGEYILPDNSPVVLNLSEPAFNANDLITNSMNGRLILTTAGSFAQVEPEATETASEAELSDVAETASDAVESEPTKATFTPLLSSSQISDVISVNELQMSSPEQLFNRFADREADDECEALLETGKYAGDEQAADTGYTIAARLSGEVASAFNSAPENYTGEFKSSGQAQVMLVADVDMLYDELWFQFQRTRQGQLIPIGPWAANDVFVLGGLEAFAGGSELLSIRARATHRSFTVIEDAQAKAQKIADCKVAQLEEKLTELNTEQQRLFNEAATQTGRLDLDAYNQQEAEAKAQIVEFERQIDKLQYDLLQDRDDRRNRWMAITMLAVPAVLVLIAILVAIRRRHLRASRATV